MTVDVDIEAWERLLDDDVPCQYGLTHDRQQVTEPCPDPGEWFYRHPCGEVWQECTYHRDDISDHCRKLWRGGDRPLCDACNQPMPKVIPWVAL